MFKDSTRGGVAMEAGATLENKLAIPYRPDRGPVLRGFALSASSLQNIEDVTLRSVNRRVGNI
jgi:hypothetical protein